MIFRRRYAGPTTSTEEERRDAESVANYARWHTWFAVKLTRETLAKLDAAVEAVHPGMPKLLEAFDTMRREWR